MSSYILLLVCSSFLITIVNEVDARSTLLAKLLERRHAKDAFRRHYQRLEDDIELESRQRIAMDNPNAKVIILIIVILVMPRH